MIQLHIWKRSSFQVPDLWSYLHTSFELGIDRLSTSFLANSSLGHSEQEHDTRHGVMSRIQWAIDNPEENNLQLDGRKFSPKDDDALMLCNFACISMGRHVHVDYCRGDHHDNPEVLHINERAVPNPSQPKDWITHSLHWSRMGEFVM